MTSADAGGTCGGGVRWQRPVERSACGHSTAESLVNHQDQTRAHADERLRRPRLMRALMRCTGATLPNRSGHTREVNSSLIYRSSRSVMFRDDTYRWVDEATFSITNTTAQTSTSDVLASLLIDTHYVDAYQLADLVASDVDGRVPGPNAHELYLAGLRDRGLTPETDPMRTGHPVLWEMSNRAGPDHGPYKLSAIGVSTFDQLDGPGARLVLLDWLIDDEDWRYPPDNAIEGDLKGIEADLSSAEVVFRLHDLGEQYEHANGWIVQPYLELIVIDLAASRLRLVAAGTD